MLACTFHPSSIELSLSVLGIEFIHFLMMIVLLMYVNLCCTIFWSTFCNFFYFFSLVEPWSNPFCQSRRCILMNWLILLNFVISFSAKILLIGWATTNIVSSSQAPCWSSRAPTTLARFKKDQHANRGQAILASLPLAGRRARWVGSCCLRFFPHSFTEWLYDVEVVCNYARPFYCIGVASSTISTFPFAPSPLPTQTSSLSQYHTNAHANTKTHAFISTSGAEQSPNHSHT